MKKIIYAILFVLLFLGVKQVYAADTAVDCENYDYACATCVYFNNGLKFTYQVYADANGERIKIHSPEKKYSGGRVIANYKDSSSIEAFTKDNNGKKYFTCTGRLFITANSSGDMTITSELNSANTILYLDKDSSYENNKVWTSSEAITCKFTTKDSSGSASTTITGEISSDGKKILSQSYSPGEYKPGTKDPDSFAKYFVDANGTLTCPVDAFNIQCGGSSGNYYCSLVDGKDIRGNTNDGTEVTEKPIEYTEPPKDVYTPNLNYDNFCANEGVKDVFRIIGYLVAIARYLVPLLIIVLGLVDFGKAATTNDDKALNKAVNAFSRRIIAGIIVFFVPSIIYAFMNIVGNVIDNTGDLLNENNQTFGGCTKCIFKVGECDGSTSNSGKGNDKNYTAN